MSTEDGTIIDVRDEAPRGESEYQRGLRIAAEKYGKPESAGNTIDAAMFAAVEALVDKGVKVADFVVVIKTEDGGVNVTSARGVMGAIGLLAQGDALARKIALQS